MKHYPGIEFAYDAVIMFQSGGAFSFGREPTPRRMPDGSLLSFIYTGGPREPDPANCAAFIRSDDDGDSWSRPEVVFRHPKRACWGTEIFTGGDRPFAIVHTFNAETFYAEIRAHITYSDDSGRSWTRPAGMPGIPSGLVVRQGKVLHDGSWIFPVYWVEERGGDGEFWRENWRFVSGAIRSADRGRTFSLHGGLALPGTANWQGLAWEGEIIETAPGRLRMFVRSDGAGILYTSDSCDNGIQWSELAPSPIGNPGTKVVCYRVGTRHVMLNNRCEPGKLTRNQLDLLVSDDGIQWRTVKTVARLTGESTDLWAPGSMPTQAAYPHGFADDRTRQLYLAIDGVRVFYFLKIPYRDILE